MATITKSANGKNYVAVIRKNGTFKKRTFDTKREAQEWAVEYEARVIRGDETATRKPCNIIFNEFIDAYLSSAGFKKKKGAERERYAAQRLEDEFGAIQISKLTPQLINNYLMKRLETVAESTARRELDVLTAIFIFAEKSHGITPPNLKKIDKPAASKHRNRRLKSNEFEYLKRAFKTRERSKDGRLTDGTDNPNHGLIFQFAIETAMRQSEICNIKKTDIFKKYIQLKNTKNGDDRKVPLSPRARAIVRLALYKNISNNSLFGVTACAVKQAWTRAKSRAKRLYETEREVKDAGFLDDLRFHDLRHEATSRLSLKVTNVLELSAITGHRDLQGLKRYYHADIEKLADKL